MEEYDNRYGSLVTGVDKKYLFFNSNVIWFSLFVLAAAIEHNFGKGVAVVSADGTVGCFLGLDGNFGVIEVPGEGKYRKVDGNREHWSFWTPPKPVPHYRAIKKNIQSKRPRYFLSSVLYTEDEEDEARELCTAGSHEFVRLDTENPIYLLPY